MGRTTGTVYTWSVYDHQTAHIPAAVQAEHQPVDAACDSPLPTRGSKQFNPVLASLLLLVDHRRALAAVRIVEAGGRGKEPRPGAALNATSAVRPTEIPCPRHAPR